MFDVRVVAFGGGSAATLQALQDLFGLDRAGAQRLVDSVPLVVRRGAPANEAQTFVDALRRIGAQVALERPSNTNSIDRAPQAASRAGEPVAMPRPAPPGARPAPPAPVRLAPPPPPKAAPPPPKAAVGKAPPPPPRDADPLPRPIMRQVTADLEFDIAGPNGGNGFDSDPKPAAASFDSKKTESRGRNEIDFSNQSDTASLELDTGSVRGAKSDASAAARTTSEQGAAARNLTPERGVNRIASSERGAAKTTQPTLSEPERGGEQVAGRMSSTDLPRVGGAGPMSRAAVVHKPGIDPKNTPGRRRQIALLRVLGAVAIGALGIMFDSSIMYGNANVLSVLAHALAIYQLGVGLRGMTP